MTMRELLEDYRFLILELKQLARKLERLQDTKSHIVTDTVKGSSHQNPYHERIIPITGISKKHMDTAEKVEKTLKDRIKRTRRHIAQIEEFIAAIPRSDIRQIIEYRYVTGLSWAETSKRMYKHAHKDTARKALERFFEKK